MLNNMTYGKTGEDIAASYLKKHGYLIIARNFAVPGGELDIVALRMQTLVYVEVKTRSGRNFGNASDAVDQNKKTCLKNARRRFLSIVSECRHVPYYIWKIRLSLKFVRERYDIIEVYMSREGTVSELNHIKDAF